MVRSTSIVRVLVAVAALWHASALAPGAASPVVGVHSNVLAHGGETAARLQWPRRNRPEESAAPFAEWASAKGAQRWAHKGFTSSTSAEYPSPAVSPDGATVFVGSGALNATTGEQCWEFATYASSSRLGLTEVFVGSLHKVIVITRTGSHRWAFATGNKVHSSSAVSQTALLCKVADRFQESVYWAIR